MTCDPPILGLEPIFDTLIKEMFTQILVSVDQQFNKNATAAILSANIKNQNELLRCFAELGDFYINFNLLIIHCSNFQLR